MADLHKNESMLNRTKRPRPVESEKYDSAAKKTNKTCQSILEDDNTTPSHAVLQDVVNKPNIIEAPPTKTSNQREDKIIIFDLETTGLLTKSYMPSITQIAAQVLGEDYMWSRYLVPNQPINKKASEITGLTIINNRGLRKLAKNGEIVEAFDYKGGIGMFYEYLHQLSLGLKGNDRIILVAHNGKGFDTPVLMNAFKLINVTQTNLDKMNITFADSMKIMIKDEEENSESSKYKDEVHKDKKRPFSLANLHKHFFQTEFAGHDACEDVKALTRVILTALATPEATIANNTFNP